MSSPSTLMRFNLIVPPPIELPITSMFNHFINDVNELGADIKEEMTQTGDNFSLAVLPLNKAHIIDKVINF
jgi:hypothetical protein